MKKLIFTCMFGFLLLSCKKDKLTKATQIGADTFSCKVNGVIHIPNNEAFSVDAISTSLSLNDDPNFFDLRILTNYSKKEPSEKVNIILYKINQPKIYNLSNSEFRYGEYLLLTPDPIGGLIYNSRTFNNGEVHITKLDIANKIVSGTFSFEASNKDDSKDKVLITDGRFDLKLN